ncbi:alpha-galactosidase [Mediterraneibacter agrestimuris]|uniref:alpha-galactosidase n=1 Tax=Mediterraneibacter agrestimuris TaxID=2941333 RepID=UPI00203B0EC9|nr:alpha-galactosidase [Mediterraneibacter agrestimuris]
MCISYNEADKTITLHTKHTTYQMQIDKYGFLLHLYYGRSAAGCMDYLLTYYDRGFSGNPYEAGTDKTYSMDSLPQEFPSLGTGDFRSPACIIQNTDHTYCSDFRYVSHSIRPGKYNLPGLPAVYAKDEDAQTLEITLKDPATNITALLLYGILPGYDIITRSVKIINTGEGQIAIKKLAPACLDILSGDYDYITFYGRHAMERNMQRMPVGHGITKIGSLRGTSSHQYNPAVILAEHDTTEKAGGCYGMTFVYSGGFQSEAGMDQYSQTRLLMGLSEEQFDYALKTGEEFQSPEVILTYSSKGLETLSQNLHRCMRTHLCRGMYKETRRPILINSWEASYFDFTGESLLRLAEQAADLGIEMLVMDDGWFGSRDSDLLGLGDWEVNEKKLGCSLGELIQKVNGLGLKFGIWIEPEMVNEDSNLYRKHPEWALVIPGRTPNRSRHQLVLDFSQKEVVDYIYEKICAVLDQGNVEYVKWDMNRSITDVYSAATDNQGRVLHDYVLGLYDFLERLVNRYPHILIEGCSGGGGRFDAGMLYYTPQIWCSDNTDPVDRLEIQYGTSFIYPASSVGSHVSASPNHQTGRITSMETRGAVAMAGTFGYELNLEELGAEEKAEIRRQIKEYKQYASLIQQGLYYRLTNPQTDNQGAWEFVSEDKTEALVQTVSIKKHANMTVDYIKVRGLKENTIYRDTHSGIRYNSTVLMEAGIPTPVLPGEYQTYQWHFVSEE